MNLLNVSAETDFKGSYETLEIASFHQLTGHAACMRM
jgi:hypothetical protein